MFTLILTFSFGAFAQTDSITVAKYKEKFLEMRKLQEIKRQKEEQQKRFAHDSIQLEFDKTVAEFEATKAKLDSLSQKLDSFNTINRHKTMSLLSQNKGKIADYLIIEDFWMMSFHPDNDDEDFLYMVALKNEISFFDEEIDQKMSEFVFNEDLIWSLAYSYKQLYGKEIAILFVERKLKETRYDGNKKQNLTLLLAELQK